MMSRLHPDPHGLSPWLAVAVCALLWVGIVEAGMWIIAAAHSLMVFAHEATRWAMK